MKIKSLLISVLIISLLFSFTACSNENNNSDYESEIIEIIDVVEDESSKEENTEPTESSSKTETSSEQKPADNSSEVSTNENSSNSSDKKSEVSRPEVNDDVDMSDPFIVRGTWDLKTKTVNGTQQAIDYKYLILAHDGVYSQSNNPDVSTGTMRYNYADSVLTVIDGDTEIVWQVKMSTEDDMELTNTSNNVTTVCVYTKH